MQMAQIGLICLRQSVSLALSAPAYDHQEEQGMGVLRPEHSLVVATTAQHHRSRFESERHFWNCSTIWSTSS